MSENRYTTRRRLRCGISLAVAVWLVAGALSPVAPASAQTPEEPPQAAQRPASAPAGLSVDVSAGPGAVSLDWGDVADADDYWVRWRASGAGNPLSDGVRVAASQATVDVGSAGAWVAQVRACNEAGCGPRVSRHFSVVVVPPSSAPAGLTIDTSAGPGEVSLDWDDTARAAEYWVRWRARGAGTDLNDGVRVAASQATVDVGSAGDWVVHIQACNSAGCGPRLNRHFRVVLLPPSSAPAGLSIDTSAGAGAVSLDWADTAGATEYWVRWRAHGAGNPLNAGVRVAASQATVDVGSAGDWVVHIQACNSAGCGPRLNRHFDIVLLAPSSSPSGLSVDGSAGPAAVLLDWDDAAGATEYWVRWRAHGAGTDLNAGVRVAASRASIDVGSAGDWVVHIQACNSAGCGPRLNQHVVVRTAPEPVLNLTLESELYRVAVSWSEVASAAKYRVQWHSATTFFAYTPAFNGDLEFAASGGNGPRSMRIGNLRDGGNGQGGPAHPLNVTVTALDDQGRTVVSEQQSAPPLTMERHIRFNYIDPYKDAHPWLAEAWYGVPIEPDADDGFGEGYHPSTRYFWVTNADIEDREAVYRMLAWHYAVQPGIHDGDRDGELSVLALWLHQAHLERQALIPSQRPSVCRSLRDALARYSVEGDAAEFADAGTAAVVAAASAGTIPQWFLDTYTSNGRLSTLDLDYLWFDVVRAHNADNGECLFNVAGQLRSLFGGRCSLAEFQAALASTSSRNPWRDGGCVNRRPQGVSAITAANGDVAVSWRAPLYATTPAIDAYVVQWKSGSESYSAARRAVVTDLESLSHTITGLDAEVSYTVRVAAVNSADTADFTDDNGHRRAAEATSGTASAPEAVRHLWARGDVEQFAVTWLGSETAASHRVQWRSGNESYSSDRQSEVTGGAGAQSVTVGELDSDVSYTVRVVAVGADGQTTASRELAVQVMSHHSYIEDYILVPHLEANPWIHEAWFDVPVGVVVWDCPAGTGWAGQYLGDPFRLAFCNPYQRSPRVVLHELAHHYTANPWMHPDDPDAMLSILSLWLQQTNPDNRVRGLSELESTAELMVSAAGYDVTGGGKPINEETAEVARSVSQQQIPQWFYDTYTSDGTLATTDLDKLVADLRATSMSPPWPQTRGLFGGHCSDAEARAALAKGSTLRGYWVDGGCVNRRPQSLSASAGGAGELTVTWKAPLYATAPAVNAYVVQWKSGSQSYDTTRQATVTDLTSLSHTITGLTTGTTYTVRVAAVNQADTTPLRDDDGRERTAETTAAAG